MNFLQRFFDWIRRQSKIRANSLKHTPGLKDKDTAAAADRLNALKEVAVDAAEASVESKLGS